MLTLPPVPFAAVPVFRRTWPELPRLEVPVVKFRAPVTPSSPEFEVRMLNDPLEVAVPYPDIMETAPPVFSAAFPAPRVMRPPDAAVPAPTMTLTLPPAPLTACPERTITAPERPFEDSPVLKIMEPLVLSPDPAFPVRILNAPLEELRPYPDITEMDPPASPLFPVFDPASM
jgi:hypothetical protein